MTREEFERAARLIHERSGLVLTRDKAYLLENRLMPVVRSHHLRSVSELLSALADGSSEALRDEAVEAMMAKDTAFFRDWKPFVHLRTTVFPNLLATRAAKRSFRVLCAGVSHGEEAYSIAMALRGYPPLADWLVDIVGIDISAPAIAAAERAAYTQFEVQRGLPIRALLQFFEKRDGLWWLDQAVREMARFKTWNFLDDIYPLGRFDVILCRNVLIYFDLQSKLGVLTRLSRLLAEDGVVYLGRGETATKMVEGLRDFDAELAIYTAHRVDRPGVPSLARAQ